MSAPHYDPYEAYEDELDPAEIDQVIVDFAYRNRTNVPEDIEPSPEYEAARQSRIARGVEAVCAGCGCSDTRACPGGCIWATETLCSRCI